MSALVERDEAYESRCKVFRVGTRLLCSLCNMMGEEKKTWCLPAWPQLPKDAWIRSVYYDPASDSLNFIVHSLTFPITALGCEFERVSIPDAFAMTKAFPNPFLKTE